MADIKSERRPASDRNRWPASFWNAWPAPSESANGLKIGVFSGYRYKSLIRSPRRRLRDRYGDRRRAAYEGARLREGFLDKINTTAAMWADTAYCSAANETFMEKNGFRSEAHRKKPKGRHAGSHAPRQCRQIDRTFACRARLLPGRRKWPIGPQDRHRTRASVKIGMANPADIDAHTLPNRAAGQKSCQNPGLRRMKRQAGGLQKPRFCVDQGR